MTNPRVGAGLSTSLAKRVSMLDEEVMGRREILLAEDPPIPREVLEYLREHLLAGETHYTTRPGVLELRKRIADELLALGAPAYDPLQSVVITAGEGEALFATLLALDLDPGAAIPGAWPSGYVPLARAMGIQPHDLDGNTQKARAVYRELHGDDAEDRTLFDISLDEDLPDIYHLGSAIGVRREIQELTRVSPDRTILLGNLDSVPFLRSFRLGFVAGPGRFLKRVMTWKQAFSICTSAPSQRAALWSLQAEAGD